MKKILIIDDDPIFVRIYEGLFESGGFVVEVAADGPSAMEKLRHSKPDLVLLDLFLGKVNGVQVLKYIRSRDATSALPVIAFSNSSTSRLVNAAWRAGATQFLAKDDFDPDHLLEVVHKALAAPHPFSITLIDSSTPPLQTGRAIAAHGFTGELSDATRAVQADLRQKFLAHIPQMVAAFQPAIECLIKEEEIAKRAARLASLWQTAYAAADDAAIAGCHTIGALCRGLAALLKELSEEPESADASAFQTVTGAVELLPALIQDALPAQAESIASGLIFVLDDDSTSRWTICSALEMANLKSISLGDPWMALKILEENRFDLILLDLQMPGMNGFELCAKIRELPINKTTPVIFVTGRSDFASRTRSVLTGGDGLIAKPFRLGEVALKALIYVLKGQTRAVAK